ncbi:MAG: hypothetical protein QME68_01920 [Elusimicrobiota bacterium]|nr:hypothetical protein [Elusimicrobiota bacterium]
MKEKDRYIIKMSNRMKIEKVETNFDLMKFIKLPWKIYQNDRYWVPQLISEMKTILDEKKNPFWKHSEKQLFIAIDDTGKPSGRIAAVIDRNFIEFHNEQTGFFAFFESINDYTTAELLLDTVKNYLREKGITKMLGPTAPSTNDEMGLLLEGFNSSPVLMMPYNPNYYIEFMERYGMKKSKDLLAYYLHKNAVENVELKKILDRTKKHLPELVVRAVNLRNYANEVKSIREVYNNAWEKNWGFVPWTEEEFYAQCNRMKSLVVPELVLLAFIGNRPVGVLIAVPDYNYVLKKLDGKLGPIEILKFLFYRRQIKFLRIMIMGVIKEFRGRGIEVVMFEQAIKNGIKLGYLEAELSWILEDNTMTCRVAEFLGAKVYKKYRVYEMEIKQ